MNTIKVPFNGRGYEFHYTVETIDIGIDALQSVNVYTVRVPQEEMKKILGEQFTILYHPHQLNTPAFDVSGAENFEEKNLKKQIAQQIINNPTE